MTEQELNKRVSDETIKAEALHAAQEDGIVFIDEIDKVCYDHNAPHRGADASNEGVQRDLLPLVEGCMVETKYGEVDTSKILFIASVSVIYRYSSVMYRCTSLFTSIFLQGAFHAVKVSDLLPELQGRLPVRVELGGLDENDLYRILTEPGLLLYCCVFETILIILF